MKKLMLATTVLVGTAGFAAADVTLSGDARMGIANDGTDTTFNSRARVAFGLAGETDGGLSFGASFRADNAAGASAGDAGSVFVSGAFGKIAMGDVDSADKAAVGQISGVGLTGLGDPNEIEYSADGVSLFGLVGAWNDAHGVIVEIPSPSSKVLYSYTADAFSVHLSTSQVGDSDTFAVGGSYNAGDISVAAGYGRATVDFGGPIHADVTDVSASATYSMGATSIKGIIQKKDLDFVNEPVADALTYGVSVDHTVDALKLTAFAITSKAEDATGEDLGSLDRLGVGASYDLGGGASIVGGVARVDSVDWAEAAHGGGDYISANTTYDLGLSFSF